MRVSESHPDERVEGDLPGGPCYVRCYQERSDYREDVDNVRGVGRDEGVDGAGLDQWVTGQLTTILIRKGEVLINLLYVNDHAV